MYTNNVIAKYKCDMLKKLKYSFLDKGSCNCKKAKEKHSDDVGKLKSALYIN